MILVIFPSAMPHFALHSLQSLTIFLLITVSMRFILLHSQILHCLMPFFVSSFSELPNLIHHPYLSLTIILVLALILALQSIHHHHHYFTIYFAIFI